MPFTYHMFCFFEAKDRSEGLLYGTATEGPSDLFPNACLTLYWLGSLGLHAMLLLHRYSPTSARGSKDMVFPVETG